MLHRVDTHPIVPSQSSTPGRCSALPAGNQFLAEGDLSYMLFADKKELERKFSQKATITDTDATTLINLFHQDMSAVRVIDRVEIALAEAAKPFAALKTAAA